MTYHIPYTDQEERKLHSTKCSTCTANHQEPEDSIHTPGPVQTEHEFIVIMPITDDPIGQDAMELLKLAKRLVICTVCGTLRLIN